MIIISRGQGSNTEPNPGNSIERTEYEAPVTVVLEGLKRQIGNGGQQEISNSS